jgi:hypothetical protein
LTEPDRHGPRLKPLFGDFERHPAEEVIELIEFARDAVQQPGDVDLKARDLQAVRSAAQGEDALVVVDDRVVDPIDKRPTPENVGETGAHRPTGEHLRPFELRFIRSSLPCEW